MRLNFYVCTLATAVALLLFAAPLAGDVQQAAKVARIGFLGVSPRSTSGEAVDAFVLGLHDLGYVEGQTVSIEWRFAEGRPERLPELAAELARLRVDVIVAPTTPAAAAARRITSTGLAPVWWTPIL